MGDNDIQIGRGQVQTRSANGEVKKTETTAVSPTLSNIAPSKQLNYWLRSIVDQTDIPEESKARTIRIILSNNFKINLDSPDSLTEDDLYVIKVYSRLIGIASHTDIPQDEPYNEILDKIKLYKNVITQTEEAFYLEDGQKTISEGIQAYLLRAAYVESAKIAAAKAIKSNELAFESPGAAIKMVMKSLGYKISGVSFDGYKMMVDSADFSAEDIGNIIECFKAGHYKVDLSSVPGFDSTVIEDIKKMMGNFSDEDKKILSRVIETIKAGSQYKKEVGLSKEEYHAFLALYNKEMGNDPTSNAAETLDIVFRNIKITPGLSEGEIGLLEQLKTKLGADGTILIGDNRNNNDPGVLAAQKVLYRVACDISAVATYAMDTSKKGFLEKIGGIVTAEAKSSVSLNKDRRLMSSGVAPGYMMVMKAMLMPEYYSELSGLSEYLFGTSGNNGKLNEFKEFAGLVGKITPIDKELKELETAFKLTGRLSDSDIARYKELASKREAVIRENKGLIASSKSGNAGLFKKLERYYWLVGYLTSDEVDYKFIKALEETMPYVLDRKVQIKDPYGNETITTTPRELINGKKNGANFMTRFEEGEKWTSLNVLVGEGAMNDGTAMAKQALALSISQINFTKERFSTLGFLAFSILSSTPLTPANQILKSLAPMAPYATPFLDYLPTLSIGVSDSKDALKPHPIQEKLKMYQQMTGTEANMDYGLLWKNLLSRGVDDPGRLLVRTFGKDPILNLDHLDAETVKSIKEYLGKIYENVNKPKIKDEKALLKFLSEVGALKLKYSKDPANNEGLKNLDKLIKIMSEGKVAYIDLQNIGMGKDKVEYSKMSDDEKKELKEGKESLRRLLMDVYSIMGAISKANLATDKKSIQSEPIAEAVLTPDGKARDVVVLGETGELSMDGSSKGYISSAVRLAKKVPNAVVTLKDHPIEVVEKTMEKAFEFNYLMRYVSIPAGFYQTAGFGKEALVELSLSAFYHSQALLAKQKGQNDVAKAFEALRNEHLENAKAYSQQAGDLGLQTMVSFAMFEYNPAYALTQAFNLLDQGDYVGATADFMISGPFAIHAFNRVKGIAGNVLRWGAGMDTITIDELIMQQGGMVGPKVLSAYKYTAHQLVGRLAGLVDMADNVPYLGKVIGKQGRYNWAGKNIERLSAYISDIYLESAANASKFTRWMPNKITKPIKSTLSFMYNDVINLNVVQRGLDYGFNQAAKLYYKVTSPKVNPQKLASYNAKVKAAIEATTRETVKSSVEAEINAVLKSKDLKGDFSKYLTDEKINEIVAKLRGEGSNGFSRFVKGGTNVALKEENIVESVTRELVKMKKSEMKGILSQLKAADPNGVKGKPDIVKYLVEKRMARNQEFQQSMMNALKDVKKDIKQDHLKLIMEQKAAAAEAQRAGSTFAKVLKGLPEGVIEKLRTGTKLTNSESAKVMEQLSKVKLGDLQELLSVLKNNKGSMKFIGKAFGTLKVFAEVAAPLAVMLGVWIGTAEKWDALAYGSLDMQAAAQTEILGDNTIGMVTGIFSLANGLIGGVAGLATGNGFMNGAHAGYEVADESQANFIKAVDKKLQLSEGVAMEFKAMDWLIDHSVGKDGLGGMAAEQIGRMTSAATVKVNRQHSSK